MEASNKWNIFDWKVGLQSLVQDFYNILNLINFAYNNKDCLSSLCPTCKDEELIDKDVLDPVVSKGQ